MRLDQPLRSIRSGLDQQWFGVLLEGWAINHPRRRLSPQRSNSSKQHQAGRGIKHRSGGRGDRRATGCFKGWAYVVKNWSNGGVMCLACRAEHGNLRHTIVSKTATTPPTLLNQWSRSSHRSLLVKSSMVYESQISFTLDTICPW